MIFLANVSAAQTDQVIGFVLFTIFFGFIAYRSAKKLFQKKKNPKEYERSVYRFRGVQRSYFILVYFVMMVVASIVLIIKYVKQL